MPTQQAVQRRTVRPTALILVAALAIASPALAQPAKPAPDSSGPQTIVPAPRPNGQADTPGGSARNGIIQPPPTTGSMPVVQPPAHGAMPVIHPPGASGNAANVQAK
ncbi:hypothetical protein [Acidisphaera sp. L21]|uniref:hypothetical protein n=1 Tax=Acidisphaera sp. L21 TaxID=1641851 RepID=UPI00131AC292|nr:hypothetical protein [Acidisphaera sp. L21]